MSGLAGHEARSVPALLASRGAGTRTEVCGTSGIYYQNSDDFGVKYITKKYFIQPKFKRENSENHPSI